MFNVHTIVQGSTEHKLHINRPTERNKAAMVGEVANTRKIIFINRCEKVSKAEITQKKALKNVGLCIRYLVPWKLLTIKI